MFVKLAVHDWLYETLFDELMYPLLDIEPGTNLDGTYTTTYEVVHSLANRNPVTGADVNNIVNKEFQGLYGKDNT